MGSSGEAEARSRRATREWSGQASVPVQSMTILGEELVVSAAPAAGGGLLGALAALMFAL